MRLLAIPLLLLAPSVALAQTQAAADASGAASLSATAGVLAAPSLSAPRAAQSLSLSAMPLSPGALSAAPAALSAPAAAPAVANSAAATLALPAAAAEAAPFEWAARDAAPASAERAPSARADLEIGARPTAPDVDGGRTLFDGEGGAAPVSLGRKLGAWFSSRLRAWQERPRPAYRGARGALVRQSELTPEQSASVARVRQLVSDYRRRGDVDTTAVSPDAVRLLGYYADWLKDSREVNFNLSASQARDWARLGEVRLPDTFWRGHDWATSAVAELQATRYVLRAEMPRGQKYWLDRFQDTDFGVMTRVPRALIAATPPEQLLYRVGYKDKWLSPDDPRAAAHWKPLFAFSDGAQALILNAGPDATLESMTAGLKGVYDKSGLAQAAAAP